MKKEEIIQKVRGFIADACNYCMDPQKSAEQIVDVCVALAKEESDNPSIEDCVNGIKSISQKKGLDAEVTIKYK